MTRDMREPGPHPIKKAAWQGYHDYRKEMSDRNSLSGWRQFRLGSMLRLSGILVALAIVYDLLKNS
ncbi:MAG: hypothetical protein P1V34_06690 [Alphaproteobacteria bacterium]|nr:hypothetical protein [Alphaproteobacteria bacterium]